MIEICKEEADTLCTLVSLLQKVLVRSAESCICRRSFASIDDRPLAAVADTSYDAVEAVEVSMDSSRLYITRPSASREAWTRDTTAKKKLRALRSLRVVASAEDSLRWRIFLSWPHASTSLPARSHREYCIIM
jgi:hypothetical protein